MWFSATRLLPPQALEPCLMSAADWNSIPLRGISLGLLEGSMPDMKPTSTEPRPVSAEDEHELDNLVRHYGVTREEARRLIREHGHSRRELEAAAGLLKAKRTF